MKRITRPLVFLVCVLIHVVSSGDGGPATASAPEAAADPVTCVVHCRTESEYVRSVCGSDGVTYGSQCLLRAMQCRNPTITKSHDGKCDEPAADATLTVPPEILDDPSHATLEPPTPNPCLRNCTAAPTAELCASNNVTYLNACHLDSARCDDATLRVRHRGPCVVRLPTRPTFCDGDATTCSREQHRRAPTCGSDGVTYATPCDFKIAFCRSHAKLSVAHDGPCRPA